MFDQRIIMDQCRRALQVSTHVPLSEVYQSFNQDEFYSTIWRAIAMKIADEVFKQLAPGIDKAIMNMKFEREGTDDEQK